MEELRANCLNSKVRRGNLEKQQRLRKPCSAGLACIRLMNASECSILAAYTDGSMAAAFAAIALGDASESCCFFSEHAKMFRLVRPSYTAQLRFACCLTIY